MIERVKAWGVSGSEGARLIGLCGRSESIFVLHIVEQLFPRQPVGDSRCGPGPATMPHKSPLDESRGRGFQSLLRGRALGSQEVVSLQLQELQRVCRGQDQDPCKPQGGVSVVLGFRGRALVEAPPRAEACPRGGV